MYGTIARARAKPEREAELMGLNEKWEQERGRNVDGYVASYVLKADAGGGEYWLLAVFRDQESYRRNAEDPAQDREYRQMRELLAEDPEWHDGELVFASEREAAGAGG